MSLYPTPPHPTPFFLEVEPILLTLLKLIIELRGTCCHGSRYSYEYEYEYEYEY